MRARLFTWFAIACDEARAAQLEPPQVIAAFWPLGDEPDLRPLMTQWDDNEIAVCLPVMTGSANPLEFHRWHSTMQLSEGPFGVMQPPAQEPRIPDVVLVPTLGFTTQGDRIGYGKGFYDRTLASLTQAGHKPVTIGIAWSQGAIESLQADYCPADHDHRLDAILTPDGWIGAAPAFATAGAGKASA